MKRNQKAAAAATALLLAAGLGVAAVGTTQAYFSDLNEGGAVTAGLGSIQVSVAGSDSTAPVLTFTDLLPGVPASQSFTVANTGENTQDVWLQFPDPAQVAAFNSSANGTIAITATTAAGTSTAYSTATDGPLPQQLLLVQDLPPGQQASITITLTPNPDPAQPQPQGSLSYNIIATQPGFGPTQ